MPARKLNQHDLDELRDAEAELLQSKAPRRIVRRDDAGNEVVITLLAELAAWKGISESYFYALKRKGWKLRRGVPYEDRPEATVPAEVLKATFELLQERLEAKDRRIAELEAELAELKENF